MTERARRPLPKYNTELAEQFGITPGEPEQRELVKVDRIPDPPEVRASTPRSQQAQLNSEDAAVNVIREEMDELAVRLERFGVTLTVAHRQQLVDTTIALLSGMIAGGGAFRGR